MFTKQIGAKWMAMVVTMLTLLCLAQNSGLFNLSLNVDRAQVMTAELSSVAYRGDLNDAMTHHGSVAITSGMASSQVGSSEFKRCEISEKSLRLCLEDSNVIALLVLLFFLPLSPTLVKVLNNVSKQVAFARVRRLHLTLCRFQE